MRRKTFLEAIFVLLALSSVAVAQPKEQPQPKEVSPKEQPEKVRGECPVIKGDKITMQHYYAEIACDSGKHLKADCNPYWDGDILMNDIKIDCK